MTTYVEPDLVFSIPYVIKYGINQIAEIGIKTKSFIFSIKYPNMKKLKTKNKTKN